MYSAAVAAITAKIPDSLSFTDGAVLPLALDTAAMGLYSPSSSGFLGLPYPSHGKKSSKDVVVVWGGSSSVGAVAIQLATASGATVVAVASSHNHDLCKSLGAAEVSTETHMLALHVLTRHRPLTTRRRAWWTTLSTL